MSDETTNKVSTGTRWIHYRTTKVTVEAEDPSGRAIVIDLANVQGDIRLEAIVERGGLIYPFGPLVDIVVNDPDRVVGYEFLMSGKALKGDDPDGTILRIGYKDAMMQHDGACAGEECSCS